VTRLAPPPVPGTADRRHTSPAAFRREFPMLNDVVYLASCSLSARSRAMEAALGRMLDAMASGSPWQEFEAAVQATRRKFAALIGASPDQIAIVPNAAVGAYQAVSTLDVGRRNKLLTGTEEFPSVAHVWLAQRARGVEVVPVPGNPLAPTVDSFRRRLDDRVALVSVPLVGYRYGNRLPVAEVARLAHDAGARVFVDAYQAVGVMPIDVNELGCDYLVAGTMKYLLGLPGVAFLYTRATPAGDHDPVLTGWFGRVDPFAFDSARLDFPAAARRFETGTPAIPAIYAARAGLQLIADLDLARVHAHVRSLVELAATRLTAQGEDVLLATDPSARGAHVALVHPDPPELGRRLAERGVVVSPRGKAVRLSFHYYNTVDDVDALCLAVQELRSSHHMRESE
jgi:selenocysteine lyase/cysteine desulfurase